MYFNFTKKPWDFIRIILSGHSGHHTRYCNLTFKSIVRRPIISHAKLCARARKRSKTHRKKIIVIFTTLAGTFLNTEIVNRRSTQLVTHPSVRPPARLSLDAISSKEHRFRHASDVYIAYRERVF